VRIGVVDRWINVVKYELQNLLAANWPELGAERAEKVLAFYELVLEENKVQNLTRLVTPSDFYYGHIVDVKELLSSSILTFPAMDLGSGCGVPGLLAAVIREDQWVLADSEGRKADFLRRAVTNLGVDGRVRVFSGRAEEYLRINSVDTVVARAVGTAERIFSWIGICSTWNKLVLLKGPGWEEEWNNFNQSRYRNKLRIGRVQKYHVGPEAKTRIIVELERKASDKGQR
jgi:16S rRNA (guanine(527)-N(7))-methyltransferase RsmG